MVSRRIGAASLLLIFLLGSCLQGTSTATRREDGEATQFDVSLALPPDLVLYTGQPEGSCQPFDELPSDFAPFVTAVVFVGNNTSQLQQAAAAQTLVLRFLPLLNYECGVQFLRLSAQLLFPACSLSDLDNGQSLALPSRPCRSECEAFNDACVPFSVWFHHHYRGYFPPPSSGGDTLPFSLNCSATDSSNQPWFPLNGTLYSADQAAYTSCQSSDIPSLVLYQCPTNLVFNTLATTGNHTPCQLPCPRPTVTNSTLTLNFVLLAVFSFFSLLFSLFTLTTYTLFARNRRFPRRMFACTALSLTITSLPFVINGLVGSPDRLLCDTHTTLSTSSWCQASGFLVLIGGLWSIAWLCIHGFHLSYCAWNVGSLSSSTLQPLEKWYHLAAWTPGLALSVAAAATNSLGANDGLPFCLLRSNTPLVLRWLFFFFPLCLSLILTTIFSVYALTTLRKFGYQGSANRRRLRILVLLFWFNAACVLAYALAQMFETPVHQDFVTYQNCLLLAPVIGNSTQPCEPPYTKVASVLLYFNSIGVGTIGIVFAALFGFTSKNITLWLRCLRGPRQDLFVSKPAPNPLHRTTDAPSQNPFGSADVSRFMTSTKSVNPLLYSVQPPSDSDTDSVNDFYLDHSDEDSADSRSFSSEKSRLLSSSINH